ALVSRWRSTQLTQAFSRPPTNHFQNGGLLVSSIVSHPASQVSRSAYSLKQSGKCSSLKRSRMSESLAFACATKLSGGSMYSSSRSERRSATRRALPLPLLYLLLEPRVEPLKLTGLISA